MSNVFASAQEEVHMIKFDGIVDSLRNLGFTCAEVIDKRPNKDNIGAVFKGINNRRVEAKIFDPFETNLRNIICRILPRKEWKTEFVFIIHQLKIGEHRADFETFGRCYIELEIAKRRNGKLYSFGIYESSKVETTGIIDVTYSHNLRIIKALQRCLVTFNLQDWKNMEGTLLDEDAPKYIYNYSELPPKGFYASFGQMARSKPMEDFYIPLKKYKNFYKVNSSLKNLRKWSAANYASDGKQIYTLLEARMNYITYLKSKHVGKYIYFEVETFNNFLTALFGLLGAVISKRQTPIILDTTTGDFQIFNEYTLLKLAKDYPEIIQAYKDSKRRKKDLEAAFLSFNATFD